MQLSFQAAGFSRLAWQRLWGAGYTGIDSAQGYGIAPPGPTGWLPRAALLTLPGAYARSRLRQHGSIQAFIS